jgi:2,4-dienoyl-CoA reductase-like NADH-dependent reductase (Old Yellow Enzyme family)
VLEAPFTLPVSKLVLKNRVAKASMSEGLADGAGRPTPGLDRLYETWARGGSALLLTGNVQVDARYLERPGNVIVEDDSALSALSSWARAAREDGALVFAQLSHPGRQVQRTVSNDPVAPSAVGAVALFGAFAKPRALTEGEIEDVIARFARAAVVMERAGFSGVQIHGAHGYLVSQFLSPRTNVREDVWGGPLENRARFLLEVVRRVRASVGAGFGVAVKLNSADFQRGGFDEDDAVKVLGMLEHEGVDFVELSGGNYESPALAGVGVSERTRAREAYFLEFARRARATTRLPIMLTGGFRSRAMMEEALLEGVDLVGLARPLAFDPGLPKKLLSGELERAATPEARTLVRALQPLADVAWSVAQMGRMARGLAPKATLSPTLAIARMFSQDLWRGLARKLSPSARARPALARAS